MSKLSTIHANFTNLAPRVLLLFCINYYILNFMRTTSWDIFAHVCTIYHRWLSKAVTTGLRKNDIVFPRLSVFESIKTTATWGRAFIFRTARYMHEISLQRNAEKSQQMMTKKWAYKYLVDAISLNFCSHPQYSHSLRLAEAVKIH